MKIKDGLAYLTSEEMAEADRTAIEGFGIDVVSLMENAGARTAEVARRMLGGDVQRRKVCCLVGRGNNGGDGLVAARHLSNWGAEVGVIMGGDRGDLRDLPGRQLATVEKMGIAIKGPDGDFGGAELLVDAFLGYGAKGNPRPPLSSAIRKANVSGIPILAVDVPSGLDATTGNPGDPTIAATVTVTFGFPKVGFLEPQARALVGEIYVADISIPRGLYKGVSNREIFGKDSVVKVG